MDLSESTKIVHSRIQEIEREHASKIVRYLLLHECGDHDMIRLAFSPDNVIKTLTSKVKHILGLSPSNQQLVYAPVINQLNYPSPISDLPIQVNPYRVPSHSRAYPFPYRIQAHQGYGLEDRFHHLLNLDDNLDSSSLLDSEFLSTNYYLENGLDGPSMTRSSKVCHYFNKGFCKHGTNCRYIHGIPMTRESFSGFLHENRNGNDDYNVMQVRSLGKLEIELTELLRSRKGSPISIASLPMLYYEKYGRTLQAEGYLPESQRHAKVGYSLTKLLARLKNSICLIDGPHGQHSVTLVEDAPNYMEYESDRTEHGGIVPGSRQIYLTFPAESTFTEKDVSNYFNAYGLVQDVRIPCQQKRMFGFVTFVYPETVREILAKGNPHFVCGSRVLVKPYREKSRKQTEKLEHLLSYDSRLLDRDSEFHSVLRACDYSRLRTKRLIEEHKEAIELEQRRVLKSQLLPKHSVQLEYFPTSIDELKLIEEQFNSGVNVLCNGSSSEDTTTSNTDHERNQVLNLPDNPFATSISQHYLTTT